MNPTLPRAAVAVALFLGCAVAVSGGEQQVVILKDGFVVQGNVHKEFETVVDKTSGQAVHVAKATGFDMINEGAKLTVFSTHARQLGAVAPDDKLRPDYKGYRTPWLGFKSQDPLPAGGATVKTTEFNEKWKRILTVRIPGFGDEAVEQQITYMDPYYIYVVSPTHRWRLTYRTAEWDVRLIRKLLGWHPELAEPDGKCDPLKRVMIAKFLHDAGWVPAAKDELDRLKREFPGPMNKDAQEQYDKLLREIDQTVAATVATEAELALRAGRYAYTAELLAAFKEKAATAKDLARVAKVAADLKTGQERYDAARRMLRAVIDEATRAGGAKALVAAAGGGAAACPPPKGVPGLTLDLAAAAEQVYAELHPDSAQRIETFVTLAAQAERERAAGKEPTKKTDELLATAVSGWAKGRNGATPNPDGAWGLWSARKLVLAYQRAETGADRGAVLGRYKRNIGLAPDEIAQMISLLPPAEPEDLAERTGAQVPLGKIRETGIYRRTTRPVTGHASGIDYLVRIPPEYHHGRAYPVLIVLSHPGLSSEDVLRPLIAEADKNGYIVIVPEWTGAFDKKGYEWRADDHVYVTATLRDAIRHFTVDNDRVFLTGVADGANMAMDVGITHPDLFAGVLPMGPLPKPGYFAQTWQNAQLLPFYVVTGEQIGGGMQTLRALYEQWMPKGFPAVWSIYLGRGVEWFAAEAPTMFDWMSRKTRPSPTTTLKLDTRTRRPWQITGDGEHRFFWLQSDTAVIRKSGGVPVPATLMGDVRGNNLVDVQLKGVTHLTVWLTPDMIDWTKPVGVRINANALSAWRKPKPVEQNLEVLLEDYAERGDRRLLFLNKIELDTTTER